MFTFLRSKISKKNILHIGIRHWSFEEHTSFNEHAKLNVEVLGNSKAKIYILKKSTNKVRNGLNMAVNRYLLWKVFYNK